MKISHGTLWFKALSEIEKEMEKIAPVYYEAEIDSPSSIAVIMFQSKEVILFKDHPEIENKINSIVNDFFEQTKLTISHYMLRRAFVLVLNN